MKYIKNYKLFEGNSSEYKETFPSKDFGEKTGMDWIWVDWKMPMDPDSFAKTLRGLYDDINGRNAEKSEKSADKITNFFYKIIEDNPELKELGVPESWENVYDILQGTNSKFNIDDIKFYTKMDWDDRMQYNIKNRPLMEKIEKKAKAKIGWVMSPKTIERVKQELKMI